MLSGVGDQWELPHRHRNGGWGVGLGGGTRPRAGGRGGGY